jgi:sugar phosphate isomerase/epimerase
MMRKPMNISRRNFLTVTAAATAGSMLATAAKPQHSLKAIGVQLYTVRDIILNNPPKVLTEISDIGYREAEVTSDNLEKIWDALVATKLKAVSLHVGPDVFKEDISRLDTVFASAKMKGFSYVVYPYLPPADRGGLDAIKRLADNLNKAGRAAQSNDIALCYHNHAFEFEPMENTTPFETLMKDTDPKHVGLELDVFWVVTAGQDPKALLKKYAGRVQLVHLKDRAVPAAPHYNEDVPRTDFKEVGHGAIDVPGVLAVASEVGVKHYFVEQDATPGDPIVSLKQSYEYLHDLKF